MSSKDSVQQTLIVALLLCVVCSILVSSAAVTLKPMQEANKALDRKKNILMAAGLLKEGVDPKRIFIEKVTPRAVRLETGKYTDEVDPNEFDERKAEKSPEYGQKVSADADIAGIRRKSKIVIVYEVREEGELTQVVLPVHGKGLWSTLYGFMAVSADANTVKGLGFYQHGETPGLGGEVDNPRWKAQWDGKKLRDSENEIRIEVLKGMVPESSPLRDHQVDGLSGATITAKGVSNLVRYWMGPEGFGPYLESMKKGGSNG